MTFQIFGDKGGATFNPAEDAHEQNKTLLDITPRYLPGNVQPHAEQIKSFVDSVVNDTPVYTPGEEALAGHTHHRRHLRVERSRQGNPFVSREREGTQGTSTRVLVPCVLCCSRGKHSHAPTSSDIKWYRF
jgi:hypothetical protein